MSDTRREEQARSGDKTVLDRHRMPLIRYFRRRGMSAATSEDLTQEAFARLLALADKSHIVNLAEAVENAVKIARAETGRTGIISFTGSFHGRPKLFARQSRSRNSTGSDHIRVGVFLGRPLRPSIVLVKPRRRTKVSGVAMRRCAAALGRAKCAKRDA